MEFLIDLKFEDKLYSAIIHFVTTFEAQNELEAKLFYNGLTSAIMRRYVTLLDSKYYRFDNDPELRHKTYQYHENYLSRATAQVRVEQFLLENPNQDKSLWDNLVEKLFEGDDSTAKIGKKFNIPVRMVDKLTQNPIADELYYFSVEHLIPKG